MLQLSRVTLQDDTLVHQVRFFYSYGMQTVSCNCLGQWLRGKMVYFPMGETKSLEQSRELYNDPENHNAPFGDKDKAKW